MTKKEIFLSKLKFALDIEVDASLDFSMQLENLPNWDSISIINLLLMLDVEYGIKVPAVTIRESKTVEDLFQITKQ